MSVSLGGTFPNGTQFGSATGNVPATSAVVDYGPDQGISVDYVGSGFSFTGSNLKEPSVDYVVTIDSPALGVKGSIRLHSVSPHLPTILRHFCQLATDTHAAGTVALPLRP